MDILQWMLDLVSTISEGFSQIVDLLIYIHDFIVDITEALSTQNSSIIFNIILTVILFGISYSAFQFILQLKKLIKGDKGALESTGVGSFFSWFRKFFPK